MKARPSVQHSHHDMKKPGSRLHQYTQHYIYLVPKRITLHVARLTDTPLFSRLYMLFAMLMLAATTVFWSLLGARLNQHNADQLVNAQLMENSSTFHQAFIPGSHSFFIKWPLFFLIKIFGFSASAYAIATVILSLLTVGLLAYFIFRIERRPAVFATMLLGFSSVLLLIPAIPKAGVLLPVNMAMIATRNIEYIVFILGLYLLVHTLRIRSWLFAYAILALTLLMASDKLFAYISLGGAALALMIYGLSRGWNLVSDAARWLLAALISAVASSVVLSGLAAWHIIRLSQDGSLGPYGIIHSAHDLALGCIYAALHVLTNMGADPAAQTLLLSRVPKDALHGLASPAGPAYLLNFCIVIYALHAVYSIIKSSIAHNKDVKRRLNISAKLSVLLTWTSAAAVVVFVLSNHYYAADARYLGIILFSLVISTASYVSRQNYSSLQLFYIGLALTVGIVAAIPAVLHSYHQDQASLEPYVLRNTRIESALMQHHVKVVVGDYWRVIPIKSQAPAQTVMPLASCTQPRASLTSNNWNKDLRRTSFAYVLSLDAGLTDFPRCSLNQITAYYGHPNASVVIAGSVAHPVELLLFYDNGMQKSREAQAKNTTSTVRPVKLNQLTGTACRQPTIMNIVAHQDDDLLFINPDTLKDIQAGNCIRTVYLTAGDAGSNTYYWLSREQASQAAYAKMAGHENAWDQRIVDLGQGAYATFANLRDSNKITLMYLHLPDGNLRGQGFSSHDDESLAALESGKISAIHDVYTGKAYTLMQLQNELTNIMQTYQPTEIRTQAKVVSNIYPDHSDHMAVGVLAGKAYEEYETEHFANLTSIPIKYYIGYPIHADTPNLSSQDEIQKEDIFAVYSHYDGSVCHSIQQCKRDPAYGSYLSREYQYAN